MEDTTGRDAIFGSELLLSVVGGVLIPLVTKELYLWINSLSSWIVLGRLESGSEAINICICFTALWVSA